MLEIVNNFLKTLSDNFKGAIQLLNHNGKAVNEYPTDKGWYLAPFPMEKGEPFCADNLVTTARAPFLTDNDFLRSKTLAEARWGSNEVRDISWRLDIILSAVSYALNNSRGTDNIFLECGTGRGYMAAAIFDYFKWDSERPKFYLVDSFLPNMPNESGDQVKSNVKSFVYSDGDSEVRSYFAKYENVDIITGFIPEVLVNLPANKKIGFLHLDLNNAPAEKGALQFLKTRLSKGAVIVFDDYGGFGGTAQAEIHEQFATELGMRLWTLPTGQAILFGI